MVARRWLTVAVVALTGLGAMPPFHQADAQVPPFDLATLGVTLPHPLGEATAVWTGTEVLVFGGMRLAPVAAFNTIISLDPASGTLTTKGATLPAPLRFVAAGWSGSFAYLFGGIGVGGTATPTDRIQRYDPATDTLTTLPVRLPVPDAALGLAVVGPSIYLFPQGGPVLRFDVPSESITTLTASTPWTSYPYGQVAVAEGRIFLMNAPRADGDGDILEYNTGLDSFVLRSARVPAARIDAASFSNGHVIFQAGGETGYTRSREILCYDPLADTLVALPVVMPSGRDESEAVWAGSAGYIMSSGEGPDVDILRLTSTGTDCRGTPPSSGTSTAPATQGPASPTGGARDQDNDGVADEADDCPSVPDRDQADSDRDGIGDSCDTTPCPDGQAMTAGGCRPTAAQLPGNASVAGQQGLACPQPAADMDHDGLADACDPDRDGDGVPERGPAGAILDNCPNVPNQDQEDDDGDGAGDLCSGEDASDRDASSPAGPRSQAGRATPGLAVVPAAGLLACVAWRRARRGLRTLAA